MTTLDIPNLVSATPIGDRRGIHLTGNMLPSLASIPILYFVVVGSQFAMASEDPYMLDTIPATANWSHGVRCFTTGDDVAADLKTIPNKYACRIFSASGAALAQWFARFTIGTDPGAIEEIPIDFHFVRGAERIHPETLRRTPFNYDLEWLHERGVPSRKIFMTGPHGAGKSVLAERLSSRYRLPIMPSYSSPFHKLWGVTADVTIPFSTRIMLQRHILMKWRTDCDKVWRSEIGAIFDRTAYDIAAYLLSDVDRNVQDENVHGAVDAFVKVSMFHMDLVHDDPNATVVHVPELMASPGHRGIYKGPPGSYALLHDTVIRGMISRQNTTRNPVVFLKEGCDDLDTRLSQITAEIAPLDLGL